MDIRRTTSREEAAQQAADHIVQVLEAAQTEQGEASLVLAGGSTFLDTYKLLATQPYRDALPWSKVHIFFGDERCVPPDDPRSNYHQIHEAWLQVFEGAADAPHVHRIPAEEAPEIACSRVLDSIREFPAFDLTLLGIGSDGHTASLFPQVLEKVVRADFVVAHVTAFQEPLVDRITLTPNTFARSNEALVMILDPQKTPATQQWLEGDETLPISVVTKKVPHVTLILDQAVAPNS